ncbi:unnamed protein product, partial [Urochloa humidicola]
QENESYIPQRSNKIGVGRIGKYSLSAQRKFAGHHNVERRYWQMQRSCVHNRAGCNGKAVVDTTYGEVAAIFIGFGSCRYESGNDHICS